MGMHKWQKPNFNLESDCYQSSVTTKFWKFNGLLHLSIQISKMTSNVL